VFANVHRNSLRREVVSAKTEFLTFIDMIRVGGIGSSGVVLLALLLSCGPRKDRQLETKLSAINLKQGDIALCGSIDGLGTVQFNISCLDKVKNNFNLATALLHSFEYDEAEKIFAKVINEDPQCVMAYWGVAMSNFHALWQGQPDLEKGYKTVTLARTIERRTEREGEYLEAIGAFYDGWDKLDHKTRTRKFEKAMEGIYKKYPMDKEAAIFYALALNATADPADKTFRNQLKAGDILNSIYPDEKNHPGITHYIIHNYDYPELAQRALSAARAYAAIAPASAHAQHMPSHIFTRLGLWDESIHSNLSSIASAQCYASNVKLGGHWEEELHGMDYLVYAYLQEGKDDKAEQQLAKLQSFGDAAANNGKSAYVFAAIPARCALERKQWKEASELKPFPDQFPWKKFPWENAITHFSKLLGCVHVGKLDEAGKELEILQLLHKELAASNETYKANQVQIQMKAGDAWIHFAEGRKKDAIALMTLAADMEDATAKHPVTPGEVLPARELLGDMLMEMGEAPDALKAFEADLARHNNRFNGLYGAAITARRSGDKKKATDYFNQLLAIASPDSCKRSAMREAAVFLGRK
jgi:tetratricopeptide (TPR) repeat protein